MVPMMLWAQQQEDEGNTPGPLDFVFSHFTGIYLYSTVVFIIYCIVNRPPKIYPAAILPGMVSGMNLKIRKRKEKRKKNGLAWVVLYIFLFCFYSSSSTILTHCVGAMWGIAQCGLMSATQILGYTVGFPIGSAGPIIVSSCWSVFYFHEIQGTSPLLSLFLSNTSPHSSTCESLLALTASLFFSPSLFLYFIYFSLRHQKLDDSRHLFWSSLHWHHSFGTQQIEALLRINTNE